MTQNVHLFIGIAVRNSDLKQVFPWIHCISLSQNSFAFVSTLFIFT